MSGRRPSSPWETAYAATNWRKERPRGSRPRQHRKNGRRGTGVSSSVPAAMGPTSRNLAPCRCALLFSSSSTWCWKHQVRDSHAGLGSPQVRRPEYLPGNCLQPSDLGSRVMLGRRAIPVPVWRVVRRKSRSRRADRLLRCACAGAYGLVAPGQRDIARLRPGEG